MLVSSIQKANAEVLKQVSDGGTTVTAVVVIGDLAHVAHVAIAGLPDHRRGR